MSKVKSFKPYRLKVDDSYHLKEVAFFETISKWFEENPQILEQLSGVENSESKHLSEREESIIVSTLQWLGTPVGQNFLDEVSTRIKTMETNERSTKPFPFTNYVH